MQKQKVTGGTRTCDLWNTKREHYQSATGLALSLILFLIYVLTNFPEILINFDFFTSIPPSMKNKKNEEKFFLDFQKSYELESFTLFF